MKRKVPIPWVILGASLLLTVTSTFVVQRSANDRDEEAFANAVQSTRDRISARMETYVALLQGGVGLFASAERPVTREAFRAYTERLHIEDRYRGIQGVGFSRRIPPGGEASVVAFMRAQGLPGFVLRPDVPHSERHAILYLEPLDRRNEAAIGFDMYSEPTRREAMARARDHGVPAMSGRVTLVQEIDPAAQQAGFLIYLPVYRGGEVPPSVGERRASLEGFVYAPFRADDLFAGIFGTESNPRVALEIYDGDEVAPEALLHDSRTGGIAPSAAPLFTARSRMEIGGRPWTLTFATTPFLEGGLRRRLAPVIGVVGLFLSLALFFLSRSQVQAEAATRQSEQRLRMVLESLPVGVFVADRTGHITYANPRSRDIWGGTAAVGIDGYGEYKGWWASSGERVQAQDWALARALGGETVRHEIVDIEAFDGARKTVLSSAFPVRDDDGVVQMAVAAVVDITDQRRTEAALREREREFSTMVNSIPQLAWRADAAGHISWYNERWHHYTGATVETMETGGWRTVLHPEHAERVTERMRRAFETGEPWEDTFPLRSQKGTYKWFLSQAVPIHDEDGRVRGWLGTHTDVTEELEAREAEARAIREAMAREAAEAREAQLRQHAVELERSNRELQDFAYVASHDLQEPLRKIAAFADLLRIEFSDALGADGLHYLSRMQDAALRMSSLIRDLLAYSRVTTKAQPFAPVNLDSTLADVLQDLWVRIEDTGGRVEAEPLPTLEADPTQMRQLFQNLVANALKFHRPGVPPAVRVRAMGGREGDASTVGDFCRIEVEDNGIGFDEKYTERIFAPFQRLHGRSEYEGTGIGLAICRRIVERHGGTIEARSTPGTGSTFVVHLPLRQNGAGETGPSAGAGSELAAQAAS